MADLSKRVLLLALFGALISIYLVYHHVNIVGGYNLGQSLCNVSTSFNCDDVAKSKYSSVFGIPVASFGLFFFLLLAYFNSKLNLVSFSVLLGLIPSAFLLFLSIFIIKKFCLFCMLLDLTLLCLLFLSYKHLNLSGLKKEIKNLMTLKFLIYSFLSALFALSLPFLLKKFVFEAALDDSEINKVYNVWSRQKEVDLKVNCDVQNSERDFCKGSANAKITIVEFSDFQCPFCKLAAKKISQIYSQNKDLVRVVFKNFPLDVKCNELFTSAPHDLACDAAILARCAGKEEKFWQYHDALFSLDYLDWSMEKLLAISDRLGLDTKKVNQCAFEKSTLDEAKKDVSLGNEIGITSTPTIFINGKKVNLNRLDQLEKLIKRIAKD